MSTFDVVAHHRERTRRSELRAEALDRQRVRLDRLLALALRVAAGQHCDPLVLLRVLEQMLDVADATDVDELVQLLRDTDPDRRQGTLRAA